MPYKAKNWHALSHEQYFPKHCFLDICRCVFKEAEFFLPKGLGKIKRSSMNTRQIFIVNFTQNYANTSTNL